MAHQLRRLVKELLARAYICPLMALGLVLSAVMTGMPGGGGGGVG